MNTSLQFDDGHNKMRSHGILNVFQGFLRNVLQVTLWSALLFGSATSIHGQNDVDGQKEVSKWKFSVGAGVNSLRLAGRNRTWTNSQFGHTWQVEQRTRRTNHLGIHFQSSIGYAVSKRVHIKSGIGLAKAKATTYKQTTPDFEIVDTIQQKYVLLNIPVYLRWHFVYTERPEIPRLFADIGMVYQIPIVDEANHSSLKSSKSQFNAAKTQINRLGIMIGLGIEIDGKYEITVGWTFIEGHFVDQLYNKELSTLTQFTFSYTF